MFELSKDIEITVVSDIGPEKRNALIIDNFYANPDEVRNHALTSKRYSPQDDPILLASFPGWRVKEDGDGLKENLKPFFDSLIDQPLWFNPFDARSKKTWEDHWNKVNFVCNILNQWSFVNWGIGNSICPHQDSDRNSRICTFGTVVYLNTPEECQGGSQLWSWNGNQSLYKMDIIQDTYDKSSWKVELDLPMVYNRCVLYESETLHMQWVEPDMFTDHDRIVQVLFM